LLTIRHQDGDSGCHRVDDACIDVIIGCVATGAPRLAVGGLV
jgi:hypothetical protein